MDIARLFSGSLFCPALVKTFREGYSLGSLQKDLAAGVTVGVVALPLAMAFAIASGAPPERGLFTAIVAGVFISLLGGSRYQIGGPTGAFVVIIASIMARSGYSGLVAATLLAGALLLIMGMLNVGRFLKFIPYPVITGFTSGIALLIFTSQLNDFLGLHPAGASPDFADRITHVAQGLPGLHPEALMTGAVTLISIVLVRRLRPRIPSHIVGILAATLVTAVAGLDVETIGSRFGGIPAALPTFSLPEGPFPPLREVMSDAVTIAFLAGIESLLSAVVADGMTRDRHNSSTELIAQGAGNIASVLFGGIPATGAIARTATNIRAGAFSPVSGVVHACSLAVFMLALAPLVSYIPMAGLAAVLMVVAWDMSEYGRFKFLLRGPKSDSSVLVLTFLLTVFVDLTVAVQVGVVLAAILFMKRMSDITGINMKPAESTEGDACALPGAGNDLVIYEIDGPFFFGVTQRFTEIMSFTSTPPRVVVLRMRQVPSIDASAVNALHAVISRLHGMGATVVLSGVNDRVRGVLRRMGLDTLAGRENIFSDFNAAQKRIDKLLAQAAGTAPEIGRDRTVRVGSV
jgi:sulfate permease, SulP family